MEGERPRYLKVPRRIDLKQKKQRKITYKIKIQKPAYTLALNSVVWWECETGDTNVQHK
jgi:hypothetical protein